jgi:hypothetical protein
MHPIEPVRRGAQGAAVAVLHAGLLLLLRKQIIGASDAARRALEKALAPEVRDQVYKDQTAKLVALVQKQFARRFALKATGIVNKATAAALNTLVAELGAPAAGAPANGSPPKPRSYEVKGTVRLSDGSPARDTNVSAYDRDLRSERLLGQTRTDGAGAYRIAYSDEQFHRRERGSADLVVKALAPGGSLLAASPVLFNAPASAVVDLTIPEQARVPPALFDKIAAALPPLLGGVKAEELEEDHEHQDVTFLAGETGFAKRDLARFVLARILVPQGIQAEFWFALLGGALFEYAEEQGLKAQLAAVTEAAVALDAAAVRKALVRGFGEKEIAEGLRGRTENWIAAFLKFAARQLVRPGAAPTFTKQALDQAGITGAAKQEAFALLFNQHGGMTPDLVAALQRDRRFAAAEIADIQSSYQLGDVTRGDFSVVKAIKDAFAVREPGQIRSLAMKSESEWVDFVKQHQARGTLAVPAGLGQQTGTPFEAPADLYGKALERQFREAFPTAAFAGGLDRALRNGGARGLRHAQVLGELIQQHEDFDLLTTPVDRFLDNGVDPQLRAAAQDEGFRNEVKAVQRVFKLAPTFGAADGLLADGLHSAQQIYRQGEGAFVRRYANQPGFTAASARLAWRRAADTHAAVLTVVGELSTLNAETMPAALRTAGTPVTDFPNWNSLFQSGDVCECEHCRSVLSPAAYFADILTFLKDRKAKNPSFSVKDILFNRRADLGFLELGCENALTPLPYIDIVNEVLQAAVAGTASDVLLSGFNAIPSGMTASAVAAILVTHGLAPGNDVSLSQVVPTDPDRWVLHGDEATYLLTRTAGTDFSARILPNTKASAAELRAYPAYVDAAAQAQLRAAHFPFGLPFDLFGEEVRASLRKSNLPPRWELMRVLHGPAAPNNSSDGEIAAEYFGISCDAVAPIDEKRLILVADVTNAGQQAIWGESGNPDWLDTTFATLPLPAAFPPSTPRLALVKTFLRKTSLEYNDLFVLLDLPFINPGGTIFVDHLDTSCDTDKKVLRGLTEADLDRIHRFLRLWRKLGVKMWEADLLIGSPAIGNGVLDEPFLIKLSALFRLRKRLGDKTTIEQLCALCGDINTGTHFTALYEKRGDALYQSLFLNKRAIRPLDHAFDVAALGTGAQIADHLPVLLGALHVSEADLAVLRNLTTPAPNSVPYITGDLTLGNISFLWRHAWLAKQLKLKPQDWATLLKLLQQPVLQFADPPAALAFVETADAVKASGFTPDELDWLLAGNRTAKAAVKEAAAARFLIALRKGLQAIHAEYDPAQYPLLDAPSDEDGLAALLTSLLMKLGRDETAAQFFVDTLRDRLSQELPVPGLPQTFGFAALITGAPNYIPIRYAPELSFGGAMTDAQKAILLDPLTVPEATQSSYQSAIQALFDNPGKPATAQLPPGFSFPPAVIGPPNKIPIRYKPVLRLASADIGGQLTFTGAMTSAERTILLTDPSLSAVTGLPAYESAIDALFQTPGQPALAELPAGFDFPTAISDNIAISYQPGVHFSGRLSDHQRDTLNDPGQVVGTTGITAYADAIETFHDRPPLTVKFFEPVFTAPLDQLPATVDLKTLADPVLAAMIAYDAEQRVLRVNGLLSRADKRALDDLPADAPFNAAVQSLFDQPRTGATLPVWLTDTDLQGSVAARLATAINRALAYLSRTLSDTSVVQQVAAQLGLTEALARHLVTQYLVVPNGSTPPLSLLAYLTGPFAASSGAVDSAAPGQAGTFNGWYWACRVAVLWRKWKIALADWEKLIALPPGAGLLRMTSLPVTGAMPIAPMDRFLRSARLMRIRDILPETGVAFVDVLGTLAVNGYAAPADFAADLELLNDSWPRADAAALVAALDVTYPAGYLLAEIWERLLRAFQILGGLNAGADRVLPFAAATMQAADTRTLKQLLHSKFGTESWLGLCADIQDGLRERARDVLAAYLLEQPMPADAPSGKWENTNDLYAYYLLDVGMNSGQLTSRMVAGSGSMQLFGMRCFMGLEPDVVVEPDGDHGDSAWNWWSWMHRYRVWEANRKVFLWPENWIAPELKADRSPFFKDLENELRQNEINTYNVEAAFTNYLEKLDGVAQLDVAGFYQEDDGDDSVIHVFGRTPGAEPHLYYYRTFDYRGWAPWDPVHLEIRGDFVIPAVVANRLFLFWPELTEVPDDTGNSTVTTPVAGSSFTPQKVVKRQRLKIALADFRQGKWSPKRISKDFDVSAVYTGDAQIARYSFPPIDRSTIDGRFDLYYVGLNANPYLWSGAFAIAGCSGAPERTDATASYKPADRPTWNATGDFTTFHKWAELRARHDTDDDFTLATQLPIVNSTSTTPVLMRTPGLFRMTPPWQLSYFDKLMIDGQSWAIGTSPAGAGPADTRRPGPFGSWLPFFYNDKNRTFFVLPAMPGKFGRVGEGSNYYPAIKHLYRTAEDMYAGQLYDQFAGFTLPPAGSAMAALVQQYFAQQFPNESPPATDAQARDLLVRSFMRPVHYYLGATALASLLRRQFEFRTFYHAHVCDFLKLVNNPLQGIPGLMRRETQLKDSGFSFRQTYRPSARVVAPWTDDFYPKENIDFSPAGAYSSYNWELFFHAPLLIANALSRNQQFEEARKWYHFIFNPLGVESAIPGGSSTSKFWITAPLYALTDTDHVQQRIDNILGMLNGNTELENQVRDARNHPFDPHRIARYRIVAYQKTVVMNYLDNLIAWGDFLFRQDTMESINEATQLYVAAAEILGERPKKVPQQLKPPLQSFNELESEFDSFSNAMVQVENLIPQLSGSGSGGNAAPLPMLYFCIPQNDKMLGYWDTVADRIYNIHNGMNIDGVKRALALFAPPIDPGALVKAVAGGADIGSALADLNAPLPLYRFQTWMQKANEVCADVKALGGALLGALEKKDAEAMALLRQGKEIDALRAATAVREKQIEEAKGNLESIKKSKAVAETRRNYYRDIERLSSQEKLHLDKLGESHKKQEIAQGIKIVAGILSYLPDIDLGASGFGGTPLAKFKIGGLNLGQATSIAGDVVAFLGQIAANDAIMASVNAGNDRRWADWKLQESLAERELEQFDSQIATAELRISIAETELANHLQQIENAKAIDEFMRSKYTNQELYEWQIGQISAVYFQSYKLAYDLAKRAERCFRFELGLQDSSYISFGYWDSLHKGLMAGEGLQYALRRLETAYLEQNRRELEITKHASLLQLDPFALMQLRQTGRCFMSVPERAFDIDFAGHYFRRIKSASVTIPGITGPYTPIACTLRLVKHSTRISTAQGDNGYPRNTDDQGLPADDPRFVESNVPVNAIATSNGQNDSGVFELNFRDERYVPFEGAGVASEWLLELFNDPPANNPDPDTPDFGKPLRQFDYNTISDVILHIKYTAREDTGPFKDSAVKYLRSYFEQEDTAPSLRLFNLREEFPSQWSRLLNPAQGGANSFAIDVSPDLFRMLDVGKSLVIDTVTVLARCIGAYDVTVTPTGATASLAPTQKFGTLQSATFTAQGIAIDPGAAPIEFKIDVTPTAGQLFAVEDFYLVLGYGWV